MHLLPSHATELEKSFSLAVNPAVRLDTPVGQIRAIKLIGTPPSWLPFLVYEYGLGELSPYVPNLYQLIDEGVDWQRVRGTPDAISRGLDWVGYAGAIEEAPVRRLRWHLFMLELDRVRDQEEPDLFRIEGITQLSVPVRSHFWRGFKTYDVRAVDYGWKSWSNAIWSAYSGVRIRSGGAKWSFGRIYDLDHVMTEAELTALGVWLPPVGGARPYTWEAVPWPAVPWAGQDEQTRRDAIIGDLAAMTAWATFLDAGGHVIGHRRARAWAPVVMAGADAPYDVAGVRVAPADTSPSAMYFEAMTDFSDGFPAVAEKWQIRLGAALVDPSRPGLMWADPDELTGGTVAVEVDQTIEFGRTVRERCRALLRVV